MAKNLRLKAARASMDISQEALAKKIGVTRQTINAVENGDYNPTINLCIAICRALGKTLVIYAIASALCVVLNEFIGFLESDFSGMVFVAGAVYLWWVISLAVKECMFGVSGKQVLYNALTVIVLIPIYVMIILPDEDEPPFAIAINGALTEKAVVLAALLLYMIATVIILVSYYRTRHTKQ